MNKRSKSREETPSGIPNLKIVYDRVPILSVIHHPVNPNEGDVGEIMESISQIGCYRPIIVQLSTGHILAGNHTCKALKELGATEVDVALVDCDDETALDILLADNHVAEHAVRNPIILSELLAEIRERRGTLGGTSYTDEELDDLLSVCKQTGGPGGDDDGETENDESESARSEMLDRAKQLREHYGVELGQIWRVGTATIFCGDCLDPELWRNLPIIEAVYSDPPYGLGIVSRDGHVGGGLLAKTSTYLAVDGDSSPDMAQDAYINLEERFEGATHIWWGANHYASALHNSSCWLVWSKNVNGNFADAELAFTNAPGAVRLFEHTWNGMIRASERGKRWHPTQKPVALAEWVIETLKLEGKTILDPFAGAGGCAIASIRAGCEYYGVEIEPVYVAVILHRLSEEVGEEPERVGSFLVV